ncbi:hypothetical protein ThrDRAFT_03153 [Frankia casuarinae]|uniref:Methyltransferase n=1 Tax=Frankia casuarinae (strain DSM 45818 / CECT 9043 / HFP020203 / CcI3) TaxID=106370 RepID=Q2JC21_FRACC|nr:MULTISPECIES: SAM-dependent methyltransferase [Frankia]ABD11171.1 protein of unknown function DUF574 [Frankia casuarinae]ETA00826.1 hypothetical protein CcI6DRAFT_03767 [Frankia sp. CcI6]EYT91226.1 hypothetical protein ThrDRAFT_03153 [Frankia casuarinae]OAA21478.1 S-adenosyl methyltransferase [Frankia casuarinae]
MNRAFLRNAVRFLAADCGIRQFLDIGTGLPATDNTHEVAQGVAPDARIVYVDNDPLVLTHARALLTSTPAGRTAYVEADLADPESILSSPVLADTLDLTRPVALSLIAILHFFPDVAEPYAIVARLMDALPAGSYLMLSHATGDFDPAVARAADSYRSQGIAGQLRSRAEVARFFDGLDLVNPGLVVAHRWRPGGPVEELADAQVSIYSAVARKP